MSPSEVTTGRGTRRTRLPRLPGLHGTVTNLPAFAETFACRAGQPMATRPEEERCAIW